MLALALKDLKRKSIQKPNNMFKYQEAKRYVTNTSY